MRATIRLNLFLKMPLHGFVASFNDLNYVALSVNKLYISRLTMQVTLRIACTSLSRTVCCCSPVCADQPTNNTVHGGWSRGQSCPANASRYNTHCAIAASLRGLMLTLLSFLVLLRCCQTHRTDSRNRGTCQPCIHG